MKMAPLLAPKDFDDYSENSFDKLTFMVYTLDMATHFDLTKLQEAKRPVRTVQEHTVEFLELQDSMDRMGLMIPILIRGNGEVIDGHRRVRAAKRLGWVDIPFSVRELSSNDELVAQIRLNQLTIEEYRMAISRLIDENSLDKLASVGYVLGRNIDWVAEILGLRTLSPIVRKSVDKGWIHIKVAILLAKLPKGRQRELLPDSIEIPVSDQLPQLQQEVRKRFETKLDRRTLKKIGCDTPILRSERVVQNELEQPTEAMRMITKYEAKSPFEGWQLALRWALQQDPESLETRTLKLGASE